MALLGREGPIWPIHSARKLHTQAQLSYLWQFEVDDQVSGINREMLLLVQDVTIPGYVIEAVPFNVAETEWYRSGRSKRGGVVSATFLEIEGGAVDRFFRNWLDQIDPVDQTSTMKARYRAPQGRVFGQGFLRDAALQVYRRSGGLSCNFALKRLRPQKVGGYKFGYNDSGPMMIPVEMVCDEVERVL